MSRVSHWWRQWDRIWRRIAIPVALDLGSQHTRIIIQGRLYWAEPTCVLVDTGRQEIIEIGQRALALWHKTPSHMAVKFPIQAGVVVDSGLAQEYLQLVWQRVHSQLNLKPWQWPTISVAIAATMSPVEQQTLQAVLHHSWRGDVHLVSKAQALIHNPALWAGGLVAHRQGLVLAVGADLTEIVVVVAGRVVGQHTLDWGGNLVTSTLQTQVAQRYHVQLSWQAAEQLKKEVAALPAILKTDDQIVVRGKDMIKAIPVSLKIPVSECMEWWQPLYVDLTQRLTQYLQRVSATPYTQALQAGITVVGGGALVPGLVAVLAPQLASDCRVGADPAHAEVKGLYYVATGR